MITPKELYDRNRCMLDQHIDYDQRGLDCILSSIKEFGNMMYNQALEDAVESAELTDVNSYSKGTPYLDDHSILKLKK